jgi:hypothetical protein
MPLTVPVWANRAANSALHAHHCGLDDVTCLDVPGSGSLTQGALHQARLASAPRVRLSRGHPGHAAALGIPNAFTAELGKHVDLIPDSACSAQTDERS